MNDLTYAVAWLGKYLATIVFLVYNSPKTVEKELGNFLEMMAEMLSKVQRAWTDHTSDTVISHA
jgi:hypothetical protein